MTEAPAPQQLFGAGLLNKLAVVIEPIREQLDPLLDAQVPDGTLLCQKNKGILSDHVFHIPGTLNDG